MGIGHSRSNLTGLVVSVTSVLTVIILLGTVSGCGGTSSGATGPEKPLLAKDAVGTTIVIPKKAPERIISMGASDSEILGALDLASRVVAVDFYTDYPADLASKPKISDSNGNYDVEAIVADRPDLVLSYGGEYPSVDAQLKAVNIDVVDLPALDLTGTLLEIRLVGQLVHDESAANQLVASLDQRIAAVKAKVAGVAPVSVYMEVYYSAPTASVFGGTSFGDELIRDAGGTNVFGDDSSNGGYPNVDDESIIAANPQVIILTEDAADGGIPALVYQRPGWSVISAVKTHRVYTLNTDESEEAGPRLVDALEQLAKLLHPDQFT